MIIPRGIHPVSIPGSRVKVSLGAGNLAHLGEIARDAGAKRVLLVTDPGIIAAGHPDRAIAALRAHHIHTELFDGAAENPTTEHVARGVEFARGRQIDFIIGLGGGSSMDCAKGMNFLLTNGGKMQDYWGVDLAKKSLLPMIAIPTTAGTGSDAQSFALITDPVTHQKMACGAPSALPIIAILDPQLTATQPARVAAATAIDAVAHAVETSATKRRTDISRELSIAAWKLLDASFEVSLRERNSQQSSSDTAIGESMLAGAHLAGAAIENSMLGAAHSLANALTALCGIVHGVAVGMMLPHVIRFNSRDDNPYSDLNADAEALARRIEQLLLAGNLTRTLRDYGVPADLIPALAGIAAKQWTATFNPRPVGENEMREILERAL